MNADTTRRSVTFDEVAAAADSLANDGKSVTLEAVRDALGDASPNLIGRHLGTWRAARADAAAVANPPTAAMPESLVADLARWAQQFAEEAGAGTRDALAQARRDMEDVLAAGEQLEAERDTLVDEVASATAARDQATAAAAERSEEIERLNAELRNARQVAMDALVGKAKDQLAIEGKDAQLADLRAQIERNVAASAAESDARLRAEMELVGATTVRDSLAAEVKDLQAQLAAVQAERSALRAEVETLRARAK